MAKKKGRPAIEPKKKADMKAKFLEVLGSEECAGNVSFALEKTGYNRDTMYKWKNEDEDFARKWEEAVDKGYERLADEAENALRKGINELLNPTLIIFALKNRRVGRWRDRSEIEHSGGIDLRGATNEKLDEILEGAGKTSKAGKDKKAGG